MHQNSMIALQEQEQESIDAIKTAPIFNTISKICQTCLKMFKGDIFLDNFGHL